MNIQYKRDFLRAGAIAKQVRAFGKSLIFTGASYTHTIAQINQKIVELGGKAAFPPQIALDHVAAHFLPNPNDDIIFANQVAKLDIGVSVNGAIGDCAVTVDLSGKYQPLIDAVEAALLAAERSIKVGQPLREIGVLIDQTISSYGFHPVRNLCGHGLGKYQIHTAPSIPNCDNHSKGLVTAGMTFAIEPFGTDGKGMIYETGTPTIFSCVGKGTVRSDLAKTLWTQIKKYEGLPFAIHDLVSAQFPANKVFNGLQELVRAGIIHGYPPLVEEAGGMVAQAENSVLVDENGIVHITTR